MRGLWHVSSAPGARLPSHNSSNAVMASFYFISPITMLIADSTGEDDLDALLGRIQTYEHLEAQHEFSRLDAAAIVPPVVVPADEDALDALLERIQTYEHLEAQFDASRLDAAATVTTVTAFPNTTAAMGGGQPPRPAARDGHMDCGVCLERFSSTRVRQTAVPCGHIFCSACLLQLYNRHRIVAGHQVPCPVCRQDIFLCMPTEVVLASGTATDGSDA